MWLPVVGVFLGVVIGLLTGVHIPAGYSVYITIAILAVLDTLVGGCKASLEKEFEDSLFISGLIINLFFALSLAFLGDQLGVDLYLAAVFAFGVRLFRNIAIMRRELLKQWKIK
ncbi:small basic family protein [Alteribacillus bidgolensis]|uniref:Small basic protein n=1 Tax=Alteribacillus bidgolensis TaxID=930129 RepID=A0A1G8G9U7_9BACI|nr:DUF1290 domain-containing protein [Alteribacillus bidgolensis]SDH91154.1 Small basic protein [Alteribacillus bidgolensis]